LVGNTKSYDFVIDSAGVSQGIVDVRSHQEIEDVSAPQSQIVTEDGETVSIVHLHWVNPDQVIMKSDSWLPNDVLFSLAVAAVGSCADSSRLKQEDSKARIGCQIDPKTMQFRPVYQATLFGEIVWIDAIDGHVVHKSTAGNADSQGCVYVGQGALLEPDMLNGKCRAAADLSKFPSIDPKILFAALGMMSTGSKATCVVRNTFCRNFKTMQSKGFTPRKKAIANRQRDWRNSSPSRTLSRYSSR
jgi:hypothetical protein